MAQFLDYTGLGHFKDKNDALYAKQDGSYEGMTVGNAEQLVSTVGVEDSAPYTFRTTGGSADVGDRMNLNAVIGGTVAWNQLVSSNLIASKTQYEVVGTNNGDGSYTVNGTANGGAFDAYGSIRIEQNHVYLIVGCPQNGSPDTYYIYAFGFTDTGSGKIFKRQGASGTSSVDLIVKNGVTVNNLVFRPQVFDLTAMFGSSIADYVYTLERDTAGAGIAWLKKYGWFTKPYYPYAAANLQSVKTSAHKTIWFNQWDEEWELGYYNVDTGVSGASNSQIRCKNKIKVVPNTTYYIKTSGTLWILEYDADDIYLNKYISKTNQVFTTSANTQYIRFYTLSSYGTTYKHDICINLSWDGERDGEYEPYEAHTYALDDVELRGIPKLDASNNLYYDGDVYTPSGEVQRRYKEETFDGTESGWTWYASYNQAYISLQSAAKYDAGTISYVCDKLQAVSSNSRQQNIGNFAALVSSGASVAFSAPNCDTLDKFKTWLGTNNVTFVYELATPTTESADPYQQTQIVDDFGTEEFVDAAVEANERDVAIPVGHETFYQNNLKAKLEMAPNSPDGDGVYVVQQTNGENEYIPLVIPVELPTFPSDDGTYVLKITVSDGTVAKAWVEEV